MVSTGMTLVKYLLFAFNLIFALSGLALLIIGALIQTKYQLYNHFMDARLFTAPIILMLVGVVVFVVASFGCCGAIMENHCMVVTFSIFLVVIFILELAAGIAGYVLQDDVSKVMEEKMNEGLQMYSTNEEASKAWNVLQHDLHCCGVQKPEDWETVFHNDTLPWSCCSPNSNATTGADPFEDPHCTMGVVLLSDEKETGVYSTGCLSAMIKALQQNSVILSSVGIGIALIQIVGVVFSCCLAKSIRREYESV